MGETRETVGAASLRDSAELPAGRELDVAVAVRVMGWRMAIPEFVRHGMLTPPDSADDHAARVPAYSSDVAAAFEVVTALSLMQPDPWMVTIQNWNYYGRRWWTVALTTHVLGPKVDDVEADTLPLAICRAALRAVGTSGEVPADSAFSLPVHRGLNR